MPDGRETGALTEPKPIDCVLCEGLTVEIRDEMIRVVAWVDLETVKEGSAPERRIVLRAALPTLVARTLIRELRRAVARGGN